MRLYANGLVTNEYNEVLLIRRNDSRTWATPGGGIEAGELPPAGAAREVEEETGIKVQPVRLVEMQFRPERPAGMLVFVFRCLQRGGQITPSEESPQVGFFPARKFPRPMFHVHQAMLANGLAHHGGPPRWRTLGFPAVVRIVRDLLYRYWDLRRQLKGSPPFMPAATWQIGAFCVIRNPAGEVLWVRRGDKELWNLPGGGPDGIEPPWETAVRETREETGLEVRLTDCRGVYIRPPRAHMVFIFTAETNGGTLALNPEASGFGYFAPGNEPANSLATHVERVAESVSGRGPTLFREQPYTSY